MTPPVSVFVLSPLRTRSRADDTLGFVHLDGDTPAGIERVDADPGGVGPGDERPPSERGVVPQEGVAGDPDLAVPAPAGGERDPGDPREGGAVVEPLELDIGLRH